MESTFVACNVGIGGIVTNDQVFRSGCQVCDATVVVWWSESFCAAMWDGRSLWNRGVMLPPARAEAKMERRSVSVLAEWKAARGVLRYLLR